MALVFDQASIAHIGYGTSVNSMTVSVTTAGTNELLVCFARANINTVTNLSAPTVSGASLTWSTPVSKLTTDNGGMVWVSYAWASAQLTGATVTIGWTGDNGSAASAAVLAFTGASSIPGTPVTNGQGGTSAGAALTISDSVTTSAGSMIAMAGEDYDDAWGTTVSTLDASSVIVDGGASGAVLSLPDLSWVQRTSSTVTAGSHTVSRSSTGSQNLSTSGHEISIAIEIRPAALEDDCYPSPSMLPGAIGAVALAAACALSPWAAGAEDFVSPPAFVPVEEYQPVQPGPVAPFVGQPFGSEESPSTWANFSLDEPDQPVAVSPPWVTWIATAWPGDDVVPAAAAFVLDEPDRPLTVAPPWITWIAPVWAGDDVVPAAAAFVPDEEYAQPLAWMAAPAPCPTMWGQEEEVLPTYSGVIVNTSALHQTMEGFGANDAIDPTDWRSLTDTEVARFFNPYGGIGLSILRIQISDLGTYAGHEDKLGTGTVFPSAVGDYTLAKRAATWGAKLIGSTWSPLASLKSNNQLWPGGSLLSANYSTWANTLASWPAYLHGLTGFWPYAISPQNEPNLAPATYPGCTYTNAQMAAFLDVLGPLIAALNPRPLIFAPEPSDWSTLSGYVSSIEGDSTASSYTDRYAVHQYGHATALAPTSSLKAYWQTEMSGLAGGPEAAWDPSIADGVAIALWIHSAITTGNVTAWLWWWLVNPYNNDNEGLIGYGLDNLVGNPGNLPTITKRLYTLGNFSRFVRPGAVRVDVSGTIPSGVSITAYQGSDGSQHIVAINNNATTTALSTLIAGGTPPTQITPWITDVTRDLQAQPAIAVSSGTFSYTLPATSVTTFTTFGVLEEEYWVPPVVQPVPPVTPAPQGDDDLPPSLRDEESWVAPTVWAPWPTPVVPAIGEELPLSSLIGVDEQYWVNTVPPVPLSFIVPAPWTYDIHEPPPIVGQIEEEYWQNTVPPVPLTMRVVLPLGDQDNGDGIALIASTHRARGFWHWWYRLDRPTIIIR